MPIDRTNVAALIPSYFEEKRIREVAARVRAQLDTVLVVDDGSTDGTGTEARAAGVEVIRHAVNQGKGAAIKTGLRELSGRAGLEYVLILDGDGQHLPEEIPRFLEAANRSHAPMLVGTRMTDTRRMPFVRRMTNRFMSWQISRVCGQEVPDSQCGFRMVHRDLAPAMVAIATTKFDYETEMLVVASRRGGRIAAVPISTIYGDEVSKIHPVRDTVRFYEMMARFKREAALGTGASQKPSS
ncbi:MAG: glycosyltransferase family 2 protein [Chthoniobacter sp.]|nr:glycosyltransferase family 2 protein [Chthoniobacter sp.]